MPTETLEIVVKERGAKKVERSMAGLAVKVAAVGTAAVAATRGIVSLSDQMIQVRNRASLFASSQEDANNRLNDIRDIARNAGADLGSVSQAYLQLAQSEQELGATSEDTAQALQAVNQALVISGSDSAAASNALRQLSQALSGGIVRAEEWNSLLENGSFLVTALGETMGKTRGEMREMVNTGQLTSKQLFEAILQSTDNIEGAFGKMAVTSEQQLNRIGVSVSELFATVNKEVGFDSITASILSSVDGAVRGLNELIKTNGDLVRDMVQITKIVGGTAAAYYGLEAASKAVAAANLALTSNAVRRVFTDLTTGSVTLGDKMRGLLLSSGKFGSALEALSQGNGRQFFSRLTGETGLLANALSDVFRKMDMFNAQLKMPHPATQSYFGIAAAVRDTPWGNFKAHAADALRVMKTGAGDVRTFRGRIDSLAGALYQIPTVGPLVVGSVNGISTAISGLVAVMRGAVLANPWLAAGAAIIAAGTALYSYRDAVIESSTESATFGEISMGMWNMLKETVSETWEAIKNGAGIAFSALGDGVTAVFGGMGDLIDGALSGFRKLVIQIMAVGAVAADAGRVIANTLSGGLIGDDGPLLTLEEALKNAEAGVTIVETKFGDAGRKIGESLSSGVSAAFTRLEEDADKSLTSIIKRAKEANARAVGGAVGTYGPAEALGPERAPITLGPASPMAELNISDDILGSTMAFEGLNGQVALLHDNMIRSMDATASLMDTINAVSDQAGEGWSRFINGTIEDGVNFESAYQEIFSGIGDEFKKFTQTGDLDFKSMVDGIQSALADLVLEMITQMALIQLQQSETFGQFFGAGKKEGPGQGGGGVGVGVTNAFSTPLMGLGESVFGSGTKDAGFDPVTDAFSTSIDDFTVAFDGGAETVSKGIVDSMSSGTSGLTDSLGGLFGSLTSSLGGLFGGGGGEVGGSILGMLGGLVGGFFADGGITPSAPIVVGEKGPELFRPPGRGTIVPNHMLGSGAGGAGANVTVVNVDDPNSVQDAMRGSDGEEIVLNHLRRNPDLVRGLT